MHDDTDSFLFCLFTLDLAISKCLLARFSVGEAGGSGSQQLLSLAV